MATGKTQLERLEVRLLKTPDRAALVYDFESAGDASLQAQLAALRRVIAAPFEVWRGMELVADSQTDVPN